MPPPVEGSSSHFFTPEAARQCAEEIREARGVEVFFIGRRDESGLIAEVESHAFGTEDCVPAITAMAKPGDLLIHNHPGGNLLPSDADLAIASNMGNMGVGFYIIDDDCSRCRVVVKAHDARKKTLLEDKDVLRRLSAQGDLARIVEDFENRPQQRDMSRSITNTFNNDGIAVIEAGTGTGKSFAYLIPAVLFALRNDERIVISTNTINLQEQLLHKDIPAIRAAVDEEFDVEIVKGRGNYVCKRKAEYARAESNVLLEDDFQRELRELLDWARESPTGDRGDLPTTPRGEVWERVQSEADNCLRVRCPFYEECFFYNSRRRAARAKVLIVNHSLLLSDLAVRRESGNYSTAAVLPPYTRVVIDEAHHLEEAATKSLAHQVTRMGLRQLFGRLHRKESGGSGRGVLASLSEDIDGLVKRNLMEASDARIQKLLFDLMPRVVDVRDTLDFLLGDFSTQFLRAANRGEPKAREELRIRVTRGMIESEPWREECAGLLAAMAKELLVFIESNRDLHNAFGDMDEKALAALTNPMLEWESIIGRLDTLRKTIIAFQGVDDDSCRWVEIARRGDSQGFLVRLCLAPIDVRELLRESLHDRMKSEILTSATLAVDRKFDFFHERTGIPLSDKKNQKPQLDDDGMPIIEAGADSQRPVETLLLTTPFDFRKQVFFAVPTDMPDPRDEEFDGRLADLVNRSVAISEGRAFILFTSFGQLNRVADLCESTIQKLGFAALRQGEDNRDQLLRRFREDETSVLFATSSFWEGVDVRGRALELLILAKLPFAVPSEPIQEAQFEALKNQGRDPFDALVVPRAVIRFKQGFGRLIRSKTDRGAVIIADRRVTEMRYGRRFLHSLPEVDVRKGKTLDLMRGMEEFFEGRTR